MLSLLWYFLFSFGLHNYFRLLKILLGKVFPKLLLLTLMEVFLNQKRINVKMAPYALYSVFTYVCCLLIEKDPMSVKMYQLSFCVFICFCHPEIPSFFWSEFPLFIPISKLSILSLFQYILFPCGLHYFR